jgi:hypothetical protein
VKEERHYIHITYRYLLSVSVFVFAYRHFRFGHFARTPALQQVSFDGFEKSKMTTVAVL